MLPEGRTTSVARNRRVLLAGHDRSSPRTIPTESSAMKLPVKFPNAREKLATEVREVREYTASERVRIAFELSAMTAGILAGSPTRTRQVELLDAEEEAEHRTWRELLARHARETEPSGTA